MATIGYFAAYQQVRSQKFWQRCNTLIYNTSTLSYPKFCTQYLQNIKSGFKLDYID